MVELNLPVEHGWSGYLSAGQVLDDVVHHQQSTHYGAFDLDSDS